ncbi:hypothetical protein GGR52DRAFT_88331 [Hypoxylon sp. FL1284]|nr:hypothetical protein GGR52DRAFT_88331 [Hypoxylon sp. FL1284]
MAGNAGSGSPQAEYGTQNRNDQEEGYSRGPTPENQYRCFMCMGDLPIVCLTTLPCGHSFDPECLANWIHVPQAPDYSFLESQDSCPICRRPLVYICRHKISKAILRAGVRIESAELSMPCPDYAHQSSGLFVPVAPADTPTEDALDLTLQRAESDTGVEAEAGQPQIEQPQQSSDQQHQEGVARMISYNPSTRPRQYTFSFAGRVSRDKCQDPITEYMAAKMLDEGMGSAFANYINAMDASRAAAGVVLTPTHSEAMKYMVQSLRSTSEALIREAGVFKKEHEGHIVLNDFALKYRDEMERILGEMFDNFWHLWTRAHAEIRNVRSVANLLTFYSPAA